MKLAVVVDNNTFIDKYYFGEPGLSFYIEEEDNRVLFDLGYSDACMRNAYKMGIDIKSINLVVLSHGHLDHTWGLASFMENIEPLAYRESNRKITLMAHPLALSPKIHKGEPIGFLCSEALINNCFNVRLSRDPIWISERLCFLGQIERTNALENKTPVGTVLVNGLQQDDYLLDDTALVYKSGKGLVIITGCSHSGICNIIEYARKVCREDRVAGIIGGFHLLNPPVELLDYTLEYMKRLQPEEVYACHCVDLHSKIALSQVVKIKEVGVGLTLEYT